jgi:hypothetical protein
MTIAKKNCAGKTSELSNYSFNSPSRLFFILDNAFLFFTLGKPQKTMHSKSLNLTALLCFPNKLYTREGFEPGSSVR